MGIKEKNLLLTKIKATSRLFEMYGISKINFKKSLKGPVDEMDQKEQYLSIGPLIDESVISNRVRYPGKKKACPPSKCLP